MSEGGTKEEGKKLPYPRGAFFILVGYLLERFVYYGLFGGAVFYMQRMLGFTSSSAKTVKAVMEGLIYLAPIAGAILADTYLGKARTVFLMCCGYTVGAGIYTLSSATPIMATVSSARVTGIMGLLVLGICAGLMKAVYSSLGADQFKIPEQREQQKRFFYFFYWMINAGAFLGQLMTAQLRDSVQCFGDDCYFLPYVMLVGLMVTSTLVFALGRSRYVEAPPDTMLLQSLRCVGHAIKKTWDKDRKQVEHWLDRALDRFSPELVRDVKTTMRVLCLFCTFPLFWALFYQTSTGMIFQAKRLDGLIGTYRIPPEMSSTVNPLLIITLIPLFDLVIYPLLTRYGLLTKTTSRMIVGMVFAVTAFVVYALVNISVEQVILPASQARVHVYNALPCPASVTLQKLDASLQVPPGGRLVPEDFEVEGDQVEVVVRAICYSGGAEVRVEVPVTGAHESTLVMAPTGPLPLPPTLDYIKDEDAEAKIRVITPDGSVDNLTLKYDALEEAFTLEGSGSKWTPFKKISPQDYKLVVKPGPFGAAEGTVGDALVRQDGVYDVVVSGSGAEALVFVMTPPAEVHMMWLFPQYLLITIGEVLFSVSGMDFAYSQAPFAMKSTLQAANLFTITIGLWLFAGLNAIAGATGSFKHRASNESFLYAALMGLNTVIFVILLKWYHKSEGTAHSGSDTGLDSANVDSKPSTSSSSASGRGRGTKEEEEEEKKKAHLNPGFVDDHAV